MDQQTAIFSSTILSLQPQVTLQGLIYMSLHTEQHASACAVIFLSSPTERAYPSLEEDLLTEVLQCGDDESCPVVQCSVPQPLNVMSFNSDSSEIYTLTHLMAGCPWVSCNSDSSGIYSLAPLMAGYPTVSCNSDSPRIYILAHLMAGYPRMSCNSGRPGIYTLAQWQGIPGSHVTLTVPGYIP